MFVNDENNLFLFPFLKDYDEKSYDENQTIEMSRLVSCDSPSQLLVVPAVGFDTW
jgi:hypothetical protein